MWQQQLLPEKKTYALFGIPKYNVAEKYVFQRNNNMDHLLILTKTEFKTSVLKKHLSDNCHVKIYTKHIDDTCHMIAAKHPYVVCFPELDLSINSVQ